MPITSHLTHLKRPSPEPKNSLRRVGLWVIDDELWFLDVLTTALRRYGKKAGLDFEFIVSLNRSQVDEHLRRLRNGSDPCPDVVLLDENLPPDGMIGFTQILPDLKEAFPSLPVICMTSKAESFDGSPAQRAVLNEAAHFFHKSAFTETGGKEHIIENIIKVLPLPADNAPR